MLEGVFTVDGLVSLFTLTLLEIVLGIDNIVFLAILVGKLPKEKQDSARKIGLFLAMIARILLLICITWLMGLTTPLFTVPVIGLALTGKDLILLAGGTFLIGKATHEIHEKLEGSDEHQHKEGKKNPAKAVSEPLIILQIVLIDIVFSLDSVITAVGIANHLNVMILAVITAVGIMMVFAGAVSDFVNNHPSIKMLALSFLIMIGIMLVADGTHQHMPRGYVYFAMAFSLCVEMLNIKASKNNKPVHLKQTNLDEEVTAEN